ncbi:MAG: bifunctional riboflavin kinase/FAD synthetase [Bdellovibrionota bacterium]
MATQFIRGAENIHEPPKSAVVTIGNFDGVHLGHRQIISHACQKAKSLKGTSIVFTFRPHPQVALHPERNLDLLLTYDEKLEVISKLGVDWVIEEPFSREFSTTSSETFFNEILIRKLNTKAIVVGYDFAFGQGRKGHLDHLREFCEKAEIDLEIVSPFRMKVQDLDEVVSSTRIREHLKLGNISNANKLLGDEFFYSGVVVHGEARGRKVGFRTANLKIEFKMALPFGVYATRAITMGKSYPSVTNVGVRPTFHPDTSEFSAVVETHLLDQDIDLYGRDIKVQFLRKLRDEKKFQNIDALREQIRLDVQDAWKTFGS